MEWPTMFYFVFSVWHAISNKTVFIISNIYVNFSKFSRPLNAADSDIILFCTIFYFFLSIKIRHFNIILEVPVLKIINWKLWKRVKKRQQRKILMLKKGNQLSGARKLTAVCDEPNRAITRPVGQMARNPTLEPKTQGREP